MSENRRSVLVALTCGVLQERAMGVFRQVDVNADCTSSISQKPIQDGEAKH